MSFSLGCSGIHLRALHGLQLQTAKLNGSADNRPRRSCSSRRSVPNRLVMDETSPLKDVFKIPGTRKRQVADQCAHGAVEEQKNTIKKSTALVGNVKRNRTAKRCNLHKARTAVAGHDSQYQLDLVRVDNIPVVNM